METKLVGATQTPSYDEFEPFCNWRREEDCDTLVLHLPEFKKKELKVQINNSGVLKITGERPVGTAKRSRFYKEVKVSEGVNPNDIHAKFVNGLLYVVMPKKITSDTKEESPSIQPGPVGPNPNGGSTSSKETNLPSATEAAVIGENATNREFEKESSVQLSRKKGKIAINVALAVALVSGIGAYILHKYNSTNGGDSDEHILYHLNPEL